MSDSVSLGAINGYMHERVRDGPSPVITSMDGQTLTLRRWHWLLICVYEWSATI